MGKMHAKIYEALGRLGIKNIIMSSLGKLLTFFAEFVLLFLRLCIMSPIIKNTAIIRNLMTLGDFLI